MRIFLYVLLGLVVLLVAAVLVGPSFVDWNAHKDRIAREVHGLTGRELKIEGDMAFTILPTPALSADRVGLANIAGGQAPVMAELKQLRVRVAFLPLLQGKVQIESVALVEPKIYLEILPDGRANWDVAPEPSAPADGSAASEEGFAGQVRVDSFTITDGTLVYRDARSGLSEQVEQVNLELVADSLAGPFSALGRVRYGGREIAIDGTIGRLVRDGAMPLKLALGLPAAKAKVLFTGSLSKHNDALTYRGRLAAQGDDLRAAGALLTGDAALPALLAQSFALESKLSGELTKARLSGLRVTLGEEAFTGEAALSRGPPFDLNLTLKATRVDLDAWLAATGGSAPAGPPAAFDLSGLRLPDAARGRLELVVEGLVYRGQAIRQLRLDAILDKQRLALGEASARLPGGTTVSLTGKLETGASGPRFAGRTQIGSDNLRALLTWAGLDLAAVPAERLRRMSLTSQIEATGRQVKLTNLDLKVDLSRLTGALVAALRQRPGFGIGISLDTLNLDAYLPDPAEAPATTDPPAEDAPLAGGLLAQFDANLDLRVGSLILAGLSAKNLRVEAALKDGTLELRQASAGELLGGQASLTGSLSDLDRQASFDGSLNLTVTDPLRLATASGLDAEALARLGPFGLAANLRGGARQLAVNSQLAALNGRLGLVGTLAPAASPPSFELALTASHPDLAALLKAADIAGPDWRDLGALELSGQLAGDSAAVSLSALEGQVGPLGLAGGFTADLSGPAPRVGDLDLALTLRHPQAAELLAALGQPDLLAPDSGAVALSGRLTGSALAPSLGGLSGEIGPLSLDGEVSADLSGERPVITAKLATGELPLALLGDGAEPTEGAARWSRTPLELDLLEAIEGRLALTSQAWVGEDGFRLESVALDAKLKGGVLELEKLTGTLHQGALQLAGTLDARSTPKLGLAASVARLELGDWLGTEGGNGRVHGPLDLELELNSTGGSEAALIGALAGKGTLGGTITFASTSEDQLGGIALKLLGKSLKQVTNLAGLTTSIYDTFAGDPAQLSGTYRIDKGVVTTDDTVLTNAKGLAQLQGEASLPLWQQDSQLKISSTRGVLRPLMTIGLTGPLDAPNIKLSGLTSGRLNNLLAPLSPSAPEDAAPAPLPGQDLLEGVLDQVTQ